MRMIPDSLYRTNSAAEKKVFDKLVQSFPEQSNSGFTCFHSMNLTRHARKRFGEADFLISCPEGLYVLEVKGGGIACKDGVWETTDRSGQVHVFRESPFRQAETALHALEGRLKEGLPSASRNLTVGYGVVFPDCKLEHSGAEWERELVYDLGTRKSFEKWLMSLFGYWQSRHPKHTLMQPETLKELRQFLRPEFEAIVPLYVLTGEAHDQIASLTEDQMALVDVVAANRRVICSGGAGTGKTFLAVELARRWIGQELNVALVCRSPWLKNYLQSRYSMAGLTIATVDGLKMTTGRLGIEKYDAMIIDEGQDLLQMERLDVLDAFIDKGLEGGRWCFFHDINNQSGFFEERDDDALQYLSSLEATNVPLQTNCRNTRIILDKIKKDTKADMGVRGAGAGPRVRETRVSTMDEAVSALAGEIESIVEGGGLLPGQVTILVPDDLMGVFTNELSGELIGKVSVLDEYSMQNFPPSKVSVSSIKNFKGIENEAVIVFGLPQTSKTSEPFTEHYVAMSRAKALLSIIYFQ